jgi:hypothetical protein
MDSKIKAKLITFLENGQVDLALSFIRHLETTSPQRTKKQNDSLHLWLSLIEQEAANQGVTWDKVIRHASQLRITSHGLKGAIHQLIGALWGYTSTTQIQKTGQLDIVIDHMTDWLSKEMEVPAFPSAEHSLSGVRLAQHDNRTKDDYPELTDLPTI